MKNCLNKRCPTTRKFCTSAKPLSRELSGRYSPQGDIFSHLIPNNYLFLSNITIWGLQNISIHKIRWLVYQYRAVVNDWFVPMVTEYGCKCAGRHVDEGASPRPPVLSNRMTSRCGLWSRVGSEMASPICSTCVMRLGPHVAARILDPRVPSWRGCPPRACLQCSSPHMKLSERSYCCRTGRILCSLLGVSARLLFRIVSGACYLAKANRQPPRKFDFYQASVSSSLELLSWPSPGLIAKNFLSVAKLRSNYNF